MDLVSAHALRPTHHFRAAILCLIIGGERIRTGVGGGIKAGDVPLTHRYAEMALGTDYSNEEGSRASDPAAAVVGYIK